MCKVSAGKPLESSLSVVATVGLRVHTLQNVFTYDRPRIVPGSLSLWSAQGGASQEGSSIVLGSTAGGPVTFRGANLMSGNSARETAITFGVGPGFDMYNCTLDRANSTDSRVVCMASPGIGRGYKLLVHINGRKYLGSDVLNYPAPVLTPSTIRLSGQAAGSCCVNGTTTVGRADVVELHGSNFGPVASDISVTYGPRNGNTAKYVCKVLASWQPHTRIDCALDSGVGAGLVFNVTVGRQTAISTDVFNYPAPVISSGSVSVAHPDGTLHTGEGSSTTGGVDVVLLYGTNFGPDPREVTVQYGFMPVPASFLCSVIFNTTGGLSTHTAVRCMPSSGAGGPYIFRVTVSGQSAVSAQGLVYPAPKLRTASLRTLGAQCLSPTRCSGYFAVPGGSRVVTRSTLSGADVIEIDGQNFGSNSSAIRVTLGKRIAGVYAAQDQCVVIPTTGSALNHTRVQCVAPAGTGVGYMLQVTVGAQSSGESSDLISYPDPLIIAGERTMCNACSSCCIQFVSSRLCMRPCTEQAYAGLKFHASLSDTETSA
jgi:hypothetical protein